MFGPMKEWKPVTVDDENIVWQIRRNSKLSSFLSHTHSSRSSFLDDIDRISAHDFTPTDDDVLRVRIPTTGIVQEDFQFSHVQLR